MVGGSIGKGDRIEKKGGERELGRFVLGREGEATRQQRGVI